jgi:hypothetical protein
MNLIHWLSAHFHTISTHALAQAHKYHVEPKIFLLIYMLHYPFVWSAFAWILVAFRRKQNITNPVIVWILTMLIPWFYPLFFGRLPWFYDVGLVGVMAFIVWHGYHNIQKKLEKERLKMTMAEPVEEPA